MGLYQKIYETLELDPEVVAERFGLSSAAAVDVKRQTVEKFLKDHSWDEIAFSRWMRETRPLPSIAKQIANFSQAIVEHVSTGRVHVGEEDYKKRIDICNLCNYFRDDGRCSICGCYMKVKARWESQKCPFGLW